MSGERRDVDDAVVSDWLTKLPSIREGYEPKDIGKVNNPKCFKKIKPETLPVLYRANKKAWMTSFLMEEWKNG